MKTTPLTASNNWQHGVKLLQKQDVEAFLFRLQDHLKTRRLLVFTQGKFSDVPTNGRHLTQSSQEGLSIDAVN